MNLYSACIRLGIWPVVKASAEVWFAAGENSQDSFNDLFNDLKNIAKKSYHDLSMNHHPDKGGDHDNYLEIQRAFNLVKNADANAFVGALSEEKQSKVKYYEPGSEECKSCGRWSEIVGMCITVTCSGYQSPSKPRLAAHRNKFSTVLNTRYSEVD